MFLPFRQASDLARIYSKLHVAGTFLEQLTVSRTLSDDQRTVALELYAELAIDQTWAHEVIAQVEIIRGRLIQRLFLDEVVFDFPRVPSRTTAYSHYKAALHHINQARGPNSRNEDSPTSDRNEVIEALRFWVMKEIAAMYAVAIRLKPTVSGHLIETVEQYLTEILDTINGNFRIADAALSGGAEHPLSVSRNEMIDELVSLHMLVGSPLGAIRFLSRLTDMNALQLAKYRECLAKLGGHCDTIENKLAARKS